MSSILKAELPGVEKKDLNIEVLPEQVSLKAETSEEQETREGAYHWRERTFHCFERNVPLPVEVKSSEAKASFKDGLLEIHMPKTEASLAKKPVKVKIE